MKSAVRSLILAVVAGLGYSIVAFCTSKLISNQYHGALLSCWAVHLWTICLALAAMRKTLALQTAVAAGLSWGFLIGTSVAISIQNQRDSVYWPTFLAALALIPLAVLLSGLPVYGIAKLIRDRHPTS